MTEHVEFEPEHLAGMLRVTARYIGVRDRAKQNGMSHMEFIGFCNRQARAFGVELPLLSDEALHQFWRMLSGGMWRRSPELKEWFTSYQISAMAELCGCLLGLREIARKEREQNE